MNEKLSEISMRTQQLLNFNNRKVTIIKNYDHFQEICKKLFILSDVYTSLYVVCNGNGITLLHYLSIEKQFRKYLGIRVG